MKKFLFSGFSDEICTDFEGQMRAFSDSELSFSFAELRFVDGKNIAELRNDELCAVKKTMEKYGIRASALASPIGKVQLSDDLSEHFEKAKRVFSSARALGAAFVRIFSFYPADGECFCGGDEEKVLSALSHLLILAREEKITLCLENEHGVYGESPERVLRLLTRFGGELKSVFDMGNFVLDGYDPLAAYDKLAPYIAYFHVKDARRDKTIVPPGEGDAEVREILRAHSEKNETVLVSLEPHLADFAGLSALTKETLHRETVDPKTAFFDAAKKLCAITRALSEEEKGKENERI